MLLKEDAEGQWLEFQLLQHLPVRHAVSLLSHPFDPALYRRRFGLSAVYVTANQVHGADVEILTEPKEGLVCDALVTASPSMTLGVRHADCQGALFYDPTCHLLAAVHSGWRGSVQNIYARTVEKMVGLGSNPKDLLVCIGPSLAPESAEFKHYEVELPKDFRRFQIKPFFFDFWAISRFQLEEAGILPHHIEIAEEDTLTRPDRYPSFRRDRTPLRLVTASTLLAKLPS